MTGGEGTILVGIVRREGIIVRQVDATDGCLFAAGARRVPP